MPKSSGFFFLAQVVLTILCSVPEPRTAAFRVRKPSKKKKPLKNLGEPGTLQEPTSKPPRFLFLSHFENVKRSTYFKNLQEVLERFQVPRGFRSIFFVYGQIKIIKLRIKLLETNVNLFPSGIKTHKSYNRSILGHRTPDSCILHFDSFFSCFSIYFFYSIFFHFNSFLFNVIVLKYRL